MPSLFDLVLVGYRMDVLIYAIHYCRIKLYEDLSNPVRSELWLSLSPYHNAKSRAAEFKEASSWSALSIECVYSAWMGTQES